MTLADPPTTSPARRRSWRERFAALVADKPAGQARKAAPDIADLLLMSTVDEKMPAPAAGSADLIEALVQESAARREPLTPMPQETPSSEQRMRVLQREIQTLLGEAGVGNPLDAQSFGVAGHAGLERAVPEAVSREMVAVDGLAAADSETERTPGQAEAASADVPADPRVASIEPPIDEKAVEPPAAMAAVPAGEPPLASGDITKEELAVLLPDSPAGEVQPSVSAVAAATDGEIRSAAPVAPVEASSVAPVPEAAGGRIMQIHDQATVPGISFDAAPDEAQLTEAEGVLAEELAKLISENEPAKKSDAAPAANSASDPGLPDAFTAPVPATVSTIAGGAVASTQDARTVTAVAGVESPASQALAAADPEPAEVDSELPQTLPARIRRFLSDVALMFLQLVDLPFSWISDLNRNVIGVVAFLLLVGGVVMFLAARYAGL